MNTTKKIKQNLVIKVLGIIASVLIITIIVQQFSTKKNKLLILQNEQFKNEIKEARIEINKYKGISEKLDLVVKEANIKIMEKETKIARLLSENINIQKENKEFSNEIREIKEDY